MTSAYRIIKHRLPWNSPKAHLKYELIWFVNCFQDYLCNEKLSNVAFGLHSSVRLSFWFVLLLIHSVLFISTLLKWGLKTGRYSQVSWASPKTQWSTAEHFASVFIWLELPSPSPSCQRLCPVSARRTEPLHRGQTLVGQLPKGREVYAPVLVQALRQTIFNANKFSISKKTPQKSGHSNRMRLKWKDSRFLKCYITLCNLLLFNTQKALQ